MADPIISGGSPIGPNRGPISGGSAKVQEGSYRGSTVTLRSGGASVLAAASRSVTPPSGRAGRPVKNRKLSGKGSKKSSKSEDSGSVEGEGEGDDKKTKKKGHKRVTSIKKMRDMEQLKKHSKFEAFLKRKKVFKSISEYLAAANEHYDDITEAYDGIRFVQDKLGKEGDKESKELANGLQAAGNALFTEEGPAIRAGWNIDGSKSEVDEYRNYVLKFDNFIDTFKAIMEKGGSREFSGKIDFLLKAINSDLGAQDPSLEPSQLRQVMDGIYKVQSCGNLERDCQMLIKNMAELYKANPQWKSTDLATEILKLITASWIESNEFAVFPGKMGISRTEEKIDFTQRLLGLIKRIPEKLLKREERQKSVDAGQEYLDEIISLEDDEEGVAPADEISTEIEASEDEGTDPEK